MGDVVTFPMVRREPVLLEYRDALRDGIIGMYGYEVGLDDSASSNADYIGLRSDIDGIIRALFGTNEQICVHVWSWLRAWGEVSLLTDMVVNEAASLKAETNAALDALFDRDITVDTSYAKLLQVMSYCSKLKNLEYERLLLSKES